MTSRPNVNKSRASISKKPVCVWFCLKIFLFIF